VAETAVQRHTIDAAAEVMAEEKTSLGIAHAGFALKACPSAFQEAAWKRRGHFTTLRVESV